MGCFWPFRFFMYVCRFLGEFRLMCSLWVSLPIFCLSPTFPRSSPEAPPKLLRTERGGERRKGGEGREEGEGCAGRTEIFSRHWSLFSSPLPVRAGKRVKKVPEKFGKWDSKVLSLHPQSGKRHLKRRMIWEGAGACHTAVLPVARVLQDDGARGGPEKNFEKTSRKVWKLR